MNIRLIIADTWSINNSQIEQYVYDNCNNFDNLTNSKLIIEDFNIPDNVDKQLILDICARKQFHICRDYSVDSHYQSWIFVFDGEKYYKLLENE